MSLFPTPEESAFAITQQIPPSDPGSEPVVMNTLNNILTLALADVNASLNLKADLTDLPDVSEFPTRTEMNNFPFVRTTRTVDLAASTSGTITGDWLYTINEVLHTTAVVLTLDTELSTGTESYAIQIYNNGTTSIRINIPGLLSEGGRTFIRQRGVAALKRLSSGSWLLTGALQLTV